jgi:hypothetical protein
MTTSPAKLFNLRSRRNPLGRRRSWLIHGTLFLLLSPSFLAVFFLVAGKYAVAPVSATAAAVLVIGAMAWVSWRGALAGPILLLILGSILVRSGERVYLLELGLTTPIREISVYCNDVFLGTTPLTISEADFQRQVPPWTNPPVQPRVDWSGMAGPASRYSWAKFTYVPQDLFEMHRTWPPDHLRYSRHAEAELLKDFAESRFWWRFEKNGSMGLAQTANFGGGGGGGTVYRIHASPQITLPAAARHLQLLLASLRASDYKPGEEWLAHFERNADLLFADFWNAAQADRRFGEALEKVLRTRYDIPGQISPADAERVFEAVLRRVEDHRSFVIPSVESETVKLAGRAQPDVLVEFFLRELDHSNRGGGMAASENWRIHYSHLPRNARLFPLRHALAEVQPEKLFDALAYHSARGEFLEVIGNYPGEKAARLIEHHLQQARNSKGPRERYRIDSWIDRLSQITHPDLEASARNFVREHGQDRRMRHYVRNFVASRVESDQFANDELAGWIVHFAPLDDGEKVRFLAQLRAPAAGHYLQMLAGRNQTFREEVISVLAHSPNPHHDRLLIETFEWQRSPRGPGYYSTAVSRALLKTDTQAVREFLEKLWTEERAVFLQQFGNVELEGTHAHLDWLVSSAARLENPKEKRSVVPLLAAINTDPAWALLRDWVEAPDRQLALAAQRRLDLLKEQTEQQVRDLELAGALISGRTHPDDLLPPAEPHVWTEAGYVPQSEANGGEPVSAK